MSEEVDIDEEPIPQLSEHEHVIAAFAEPAAGPGWANSPIVAIIYSSFDGSIRREWVQPRHQTAEMRVLYNLSAQAHMQMTRAVAALVKVKQ